MAGAFDEEGYFPALVDDGPGERDAPGVLLGDVVGDDDVGEVVEGFGVGEERGGVAVVAHAEEDEVEGGGFGAFELEGVADGGLVAGGGDLGVELAFHAEDVCRRGGGLWRAGLRWSCGSWSRRGRVGRSARRPSRGSSLSQGTRGEEGLAGSARRANIALGVVPPEMAMRARPRVSDGLDGGGGEELRGGVGDARGSGGDAVGDGDWTGHGISLDGS